MNHRRHEAVVIAFAIIAMTGFLACSDDDLTVATGDVIGAWAGSSSQQQALDFTVASAGVASGQFGYQMTGQCNFTSTHQLNASEALEIGRGKFTTGKTQIGAGSNGPAFITISGEFTSSTTATGTILIQHAPCQDTVTIAWTATKN
jgi:hypothetical protein